MIRGAGTIADGTRLEADVCVVGTGAGGAMALRELARAGARVIAVEEGPHLSHKQFTQREDQMIPQLFQDAGGRTTVDGAITILQGRGVGGSTVHNTNLCKRAPTEVLRGWALPGWGPEELAPHYEVVERDLGVVPIEGWQVNRNNALLRRGVEALGWKGGLLQHNRKDCVGSGFCELGCAFDAKQNALKLLVPQAVAAGAEVIHGCRATEVLVTDGRATGVRCALAAGALTIRARHVCLAGSAVGSAALVMASAVPDPHRVQGRSLRLHPGAAVAGVFDEAVHGWTGIPQSYECTEWLDPSDRDPERRAWILAAFAHPAGLASMLPGFGAEHAERMRQMPHLAVVAAMLHDRTRGRISLGRRGLEIRYALEPEDARALLVGMRASADILFAAGAKEVWVPLASPLVLTERSDTARILEHRYRPLDPLLTAVHPMGSLPMSTDATRGAVDPRGAHHQVRNLWVADGSLVPTSLGGPPQLTIYAAGHKVAGHILEELRR